MTRDFKFEWEKFINGFDAVEDMGMWDKDTHGEMESFCENILVSALMHFIASDGVIKPVEVQKLNSAFDFDFDFSEVEDICTNMSSEMKNYITNPDDLFLVIAKANSKIADEFKALLIDACELVVKSDDFADVSETAELSIFIENLKSIN